MGYRKPSALKNIYYIIKYEVADTFRSLRVRLKLWLKNKKGCRRCCLRCEYWEFCAYEYLSKEIEYKGYTAVQSGLNNHISIYSNDGHCVYHAQSNKKHSEKELRETVDFYLQLINGRF